MSNFCTDHVSEWRYVRYPGLVNDSIRIKFYLFLFTFFFHFFKRVFISETARAGEGKREGGTEDPKLVPR